MLNRLNLIFLSISLYLPHKPTKISQTYKTYSKINFKNIFKKAWIIKSKPRTLSCNQNDMKNQTEKIESIQAELTELERMYHTITDMACEHFDHVRIELSLQAQIIVLSGKLREAKEEQSQYEAERALEDSKEFNKYENE